MKTHTQCMQTNLPHKINSLFFFFGALAIFPLRVLSESVSLFKESTKLTSFF